MDCRPQNTARRGQRTARRHVLCSFVGRLNSVKMSVLPRLIYRFNASPIKTQSGFFGRLTNRFWNSRGNAKNLEWRKHHQKQKPRGVALTLCYFETYKATAMQTMRLTCSYTMAWWRISQGTEIDPRIWAIDFPKNAQRQLNEESIVFSTNNVGTIGHLYVPKTLHLHLTLCKNIFKIDHRTKCETENCKTSRRKQNGKPVSSSFVS